jgi:hypothetical protein
MGESRNNIREKLVLRQPGEFAQIGKLLTTKDTKLHEGKLAAPKPSWNFVSLVVYGSAIAKLSYYRIYLRKPSPRDIYRKEWVNQGNFL